MQPENNLNEVDNTKTPEEITETYTPKPDGQDIVQPEKVKDETADKVATPDEPVHWQAAEYINHEKNLIWYILFIIIAIILIAVDIFFMKSYTFSILVVVIAVAIVVYSKHPPRTIDYTLSGAQGIYIGEQLYHFSDFKLFGLINDNNQHLIMLIPTKRFSPAISVYFPEEVGEKIIDILGARLPMETMKLDAIDVIVRKLKL